MLRGEMVFLDGRIQCAMGSITGSCKHEEEIFRLQELVDPANGYVDEEGWFRCKGCNGRGIIENARYQHLGSKETTTFKRQLLGIILPTNVKNRAADPNGPLVFMWGLAPDDPPMGVWFPGVSTLTHDGIENLLKKLIKAGFFDEDKLIDALRSTKPVP